MIRNLTARQDGQVLVVATAAPGSDLASALASRAGFELTGRVHWADANPGMGYRARADLATELLPGLPAPAGERIARRTQTFKEVFAVAAADRLAEVTPDTDTTSVLAVVDIVVDATLERDRPSPTAVVLAWAGGELTRRLRHHGRPQVTLATCLPSSFGRSVRTLPQGWIGACSISRSRSSPEGRRGVKDSPCPRLRHRQQASPGSISSQIPRCIFSMR